MRKAEEVKCLRATFAAFRSAFGRKATELDEPRLGLVELQTELCESCPECIQTRFRFVPMFKTNHEIVRITDDDQVALAAVCSPPLHP